MTHLSTETLHQLAPETVIPTYDRSAVRVGIAHFGVGNFHRSHEAVYVDRCLHLPGNEGWGIVGIGISDTAASREKAAAFHRQDGLYTLTEFAPDGSSHSRVIGSIVSYLHAPTNPEAVLDQLTEPNVRIVSLTITEGGYNLDESTKEFVLTNPDVQADLAGNPPRTVFGFIATALARRRANGIEPFAVISCDNLRHNGDTARKAILGYAAAIDLDLAAWIAEHVSFPNAMVDRIAPYVSATDRDRLNSATGVEDLIPVMSESYLQWVLQDHFPAGRPDLGDVGVQLREDVTLFETVKGRLLNASHVLLSYPALLMGYRLVHDAMADQGLRGLLDIFMEHDVLPLLIEPEGVSLPDYKNLILDRFANPAVGDQLIRIATDGSAKIPVFHSQTITELINGGKVLEREAFLFACYDRYLAGTDDNGEPLGTTEPSLSRNDRDGLDAADGLGLLRVAAFSTLDLPNSPSFVSSYIHLRASIARDGTTKTLSTMLGSV
ncbi:mannitol dehydrogenase family protein [Subtercola boreus]|uniref:mannitol dehydrogenase family protein n=1 Tax=Subtercola boreus TaxID=120213 RepID=UPI001C0EDC77|nr:mannitol dehydrogenase family protein [Subtercola boreus]